jgi:hypothetical protein
LPEWKTALTRRENSDGVIEQYARDLFASWPVEEATEEILN